MLRKTITLTEQQDAWIKSQIKAGDYGNDSEYIRSVLRQEMQRKHAEVELAGIIENAEKSGISDKTPQQIWANALAKHSTE